jgi:hypothetical protein
METVTSSKTPTAIAKASPAVATRGFKAIVNLCEYRFDDLIDDRAIHSPPNFGGQ